MKRRREDRDGDRHESKDSFEASKDSNATGANKTVPDMNLEKTGALYEEEAKKQGIKLEYSEPADSCRPKRLWRLYVFKQEKQIGKSILYTL